MPKEISGFRVSTSSAFSPYAKTTTPKTTTSSDIEVSQQITPAHAISQSSTSQSSLHSDYPYALHPSSSQELRKNFSTRHAVDASMTDQASCQGTSTAGRISQPACTASLRRQRDASKPPQQGGIMSPGKSCVKSGSDTAVSQSFSVLPKSHLIETSETAKEKFFSEIDLYIAKTNVALRHAAEQIKTRIDSRSFSASTLDLSNMNLSILPIDELPKNLRTINLCDNQLTILQTHLPSSLRCLKLSNNQLISLPVLPDSLEELDIANNQLRDLPQLPESLYYLDIRNNPLTHLPSFLFSPDYFGLNIRLDSRMRLSQEIQEAINRHQACSDLGPVFHFADEKGGAISHTK